MTSMGIRSCWVIAGYTAGLPEPFSSKGGERCAEVDAGELPPEGDGGNAGAAERVEHPCRPAYNLP
jgi:hypothetical protein